MRFTNMLSALMLCCALLMPRILYGQAHSLNVKTVPDAGTVQSSPAGITCGYDCTEEFADSTTVALQAVPATGYTFRQWFGDCSGSADNTAVTINSLKTCTALFEPVNQPAFVLKKARLKVRTDSKVNKDSLVIVLKDADMLQDAVDELVNGGSFTAGFFSNRSVVSVSINGDRFVKKSGGVVHFQQLSEQGNVRILINPNKQLIRITANHFTAPFNDYPLYPVAAFIDIGSFRYDIDRHDVDGQWKVSETSLTFTVKNVRGNL
jgi:hypothetical protein